MPSNEKLSEAVSQILKDEIPRRTPGTGSRQSRMGFALSTWRIVEPSTWADEPLVDALLDADRTAAETADGRALADDDVREQLGLGLRDRRS
jgi:hypothetical protein